MKILSAIPRIFREAFQPEFGIDFIEKTSFRTPKTGIFSPSKNIDAKEVVQLGLLGPLIVKTESKITKRFSEVEGFSDSKSPLHQLEDIEALANKAIRERPEEFDFTYNGKSFGHMLGLSCVSQKAIDSLGHRFLQYEWDPRTFIYTPNGGTHHFAVARTMASLSGKDPEITMPLTRYEVNKTLLEKMNQLYSVFVLQEPEETTKSLLNEFSRLGLKPLRYDFKFRRSEPAFLKLLFDRKNESEMNVANALSQAGVPDFVSEIKKLIYPESEIFEQTKVTEGSRVSTSHPNLP